MVVQPDGHGRIVRGLTEPVGEFPPELQAHAEAALQVCRPGQPAGLMTAPRALEQPADKVAAADNPGIMQIRQGGGTDLADDLPPVSQHQAGARLVLSIRQMGQPSPVSLVAVSW